MASIYKVKSQVSHESAIGTSIFPVAWAPSAGAAAKARREMAEKFGLKPLKDVVILSVDIPTSKAGLLDWLNLHHASDAQAAEIQAAPAPKPAAKAASKPAPKAAAKPAAKGKKK